MSALLIDDVLAGVTRRDAAKGGIRLLGVDGPSGSDKSTLAARLAARSGAPLFQIDEFVSWPDFAGWWPRFERALPAANELVADRYFPDEVRPGPTWRLIKELDVNISRVVGSLMETARQELAPLRQGRDRSTG